MFIRAHERILRREREEDGRRRRDVVVGHRVKGIWVDGGGTHARDVWTWDL